MKNILVPTDLSLQSLSIIHDIVNNETGEMNIVLFHLVLPSNDIAELLYQRKSHLYNQVPDSFTEALDVLKNKYYSKISSIALKFYYGNRQSILTTIVECNSIQEVYMLADYKYKQPFASSVDVVPLLKKSKMEIYAIHLQAKFLNEMQADSFSALLFTHNDGTTYKKKPAPAVYN